jgi:hypothetical protein
MGVELELRLWCTVHHALRAERPPSPYWAGPGQPRALYVPPTGWDLLWDILGAYGTWFMCGKPREFLHA